MRIYLVGFMGAGKTTVGRSLAGLLGVPFVDLDGEIEARAGATIREIFESRGEPEFRRLEAEALRETARHPDVVVATGGGTMTFESNRRWMEGHGLTVWLSPPFSALVARIGSLGKEDRPLFRDEAQAFQLYRARLPAYRKARLQVDVAPSEEPQEVAARVALLIRQTACAT